MSVLFVTQEDKARIKEIIARARENYIPWSVLQLGAVRNDKPTLSLDERVLGFERPESESIILGNYRVAFSFEEQPVGICRHLSVSVNKKGKVPNELAVHMIAQEFGFEYGEWPPQPDKLYIWLEEFEPGQHAVNLVEVAEPSVAPKDKH